MVIIPKYIETNKVGNSTKDYQAEIKKIAPKSLSDVAVMMTVVSGNSVAEFGVNVHQTMNPVLQKAAEDKSKYKTGD